MPVSFLLKSNAKPFHRDPHHIPLKNQEETKHSVYDKCEIGAMQQISGKEEKKEWDFSSFGVPKNDDAMKLLFTSENQCPLGMKPISIINSQLNIV